MLPFLWYILTAKRLLSIWCEDVVNTRNKDQINTDIEVKVSVSLKWMCRRNDNTTVESFIPSITFLLHFSISSITIGQCVCMRPIGPQVRYVVQSLAEMPDTLSDFSPQVVIYIHLLHACRSNACSGVSSFSIRRSGVTLGQPCIWLPWYGVKLSVELILVQWLLLRTSLKNLMEKKLSLFYLFIFLK